MDFNDIDSCEISIFANQIENLLIDLTDQIRNDDDDVSPWFGAHASRGRHFADSEDKVESTQHASISSKQKKVRDQSLKNGRQSDDSFRRNFNNLVLANTVAKQPSLKVLNIKSLSPLDQLAKSCIECPNGHKSLHLIVKASQLCDDKHQQYFPAAENQTSRSMSNLSLEVPPDLVIAPICKYVRRREKTTKQRVRRAERESLLPALAPSSSSSIPAFRTPIKSRPLLKRIENSERAELQDKVKKMLEKLKAPARPSLQTDSASTQDLSSDRWYENHAMWKSCPDTTGIADGGQDCRVPLSYSANRDNRRGHHHLQQPQQEQHGMPSHRACATERHAGEEPLWRTNRLRFMRPHGAGVYEEIKLPALVPTRIKELAS